MDQFTWTVLGLLGTSLLGMLGAFFYLGNKIDSLGSRLDARIDSLSDRLDGRIDAMSSRLDFLSEALHSHLRSHKHL